VEAFGVIDILYKGLQARLRLLERLIVMQVNLSGGGDSLA